MICLPLPSFQSRVVLYKYNIGAGTGGGGGAVPPPTLMLGGAAYTLAP